MTDRMKKALNVVKAAKYDAIRQHRANRRDISLPKAECWSGAVLYDMTKKYMSAQSDK